MWTRAGWFRLFVCYCMKAEPAYASITCWRTSVISSRKTRMKTLLSGMYWRYDFGHFCKMMIDEKVVSISPVTRGLCWTVSRQLKAPVVQTCTNGILPNRQLATLASSRSWTISEWLCLYRLPRWKTLRTATTRKKSNGGQSGYLFQTGSLWT